MLTCFALVVSALALVALDTVFLVVGSGKRMHHRPGLIGFRFIALLVVALVSSLLLVVASIMLWRAALA